MNILLRFCAEIGADKVVRGVPKLVRNSAEDLIGDGNDRLDGGAGANTFVFTEGYDIALDFARDAGALELGGNWTAQNTQILAINEDRTLLFNGQGDLVHLFGEDARSLTMDQIKFIRSSRATR